MLAGSRLRPPGRRAEQLPRVHEVAVVPDRERPPRPQAERRLGVLPDRGAGRGVAAVGDRELAAEARQAPLVEDLGDHAEVLVEHQLVAVADRRSPPIPGPGAGGRRARGRPAAAASVRPGADRRRRRRTPASAASTPRARGSPCSQACRRSASATSSGIGHARAPLLRRAGGPLAGELDHQPVAAGHAQLLERARRRGRERPERRRRAAARTVTTAREGSRRRGRRPGSRPPPAGSAPPRPLHVAHLGEGDGEPAPGDVLGDADEARARWRRAGTPGGRPRGPGRAWADRRRREASQRRVGGPAQARTGRRPTRTIVAVADEGGPDQRLDVVGEPDHADLRRRGDRAARRLVVEGDVAAGDRDTEGAAGVAQAADGFLSCQNASGRVGSPKLRQFVTPSGRAPVTLTLRVASATESAAPRYGSSAATAWLRVGRGHERLAGPLDPEHGGARPGPATVFVWTWWSYCS